MSGLGAERARLQLRNDNKGWKKWGPYLTERQWGTVREDYSAHGNAWGTITHDMARSKAYRWGEEGIGGISDNKQHVCFAFAFWNHRDHILKERFFGLTGSPETTSMSQRPSLEARFTKSNLISWVAAEDADSRITSSASSSRFSSWLMRD